MRNHANYELTPDWTKVEDNQIELPDHLDPLLNKIGMQVRFHTLSGKNELLTICHIVRIAEEFFLKPKSEIINPTYETPNSLPLCASAGDKSCKV